MNATLVQAGSTLEHQAVAQTWQGEPLSTYVCRLDALAQRLPRMERRPFEVRPSESRRISAPWLPGLPPQVENPYYDLVVRVPDQQIRSEVPVGLVSKRYRLVQHHELVEGVVNGLKAVKLSWDSLRTDVRITEFGSRLHVTVHLPERFRAAVGHDELDLTIERLNSVDRSWAFRVGMGWIRLVCGNGLFVGRVTATMRRAHVESLRVGHVPGLIARGSRQRK